MNACDVLRVRMFIDGLDEVNYPEMRAVVADLHKLTNLINRQESPLSICYGCRDYPAVVVGNGIQIHVHGHNEADLNLSRFRISPSPALFGLALSIATHLYILLIALRNTTLV
jgi:hypothetical protein